MAAPSGDLGKSEGLVFVRNEQKVFPQALAAIDKIGGRCFLWRSNGRGPVDKVSSEYAKSSFTDRH